MGANEQLVGPVKIKLHFSRVNMQRRDPRVWSAHTHKSCNQSESVLIRHGGKLIGRTVFREGAEQPRAYIEFAGTVERDDQGNAVIVIDE
jgi:hypothetical protein